MAALSEIDLHLHTNHSDGNWTPAQLVAHAAKIGLKTVAITDHDTISGIKEAEESLSGGRYDLELIPGIEINTVWTDPQGERHDIHVLGYFVDGSIETINAALTDVLRRQRQARIDQVDEMVGRLRRSGLAISMEMIEELAGGSPIGKVHITRAIVQAGGASDVSQAYATFFSRSSPFYVHRKSIGPHEAVRSIKEAGGLSSLAHPGKGAYVSNLIKDLNRVGLDAIESYHRIHDAETTAELKELAGSLGMCVTGGSDCHGPFEEHQSLMGTIHVPCAVLDDLKERSRR